MLMLRLGERMSEADRRAVERMRSVPGSATEQARFLLRWLVELPRRRPGRAGALARAIAWRRLVRLRNRVGRRPAVPTVPPSDRWDRRGSGSP